MQLSACSVMNSILSLQSGKFVALSFALMIVSFYGGSLFGGRRIVYTQQSLGTLESVPGRLENRISSCLRSDTVNIPETGMNICPMERSEYVPCHDRSFIKKMVKNIDLSRKEDLERHCPPPESRPFCLVPPPRGYRVPINWPQSRDFIWRSNVNHSRLAQVKGGQNWVHENGTKWWFPGGGTHFKHGAAEYIERLGNMITNDQGNLQTAGVVQVLDVGCGVGSFAAYLLPLGIQTMSFAPMDEHENQVQFALERGILAMISVLATTRLPFPSNSFELIHCSRCRVDWHKNVDRLLRPRGYFVYSAPPAYRTDKDFPQIWNELMHLTSSMCWELIGRHVQTAIWLKTSNRSCQLEKAQSLGLVSLCDDKYDPDKAWNTSMQNCIVPSPEMKDIEWLPKWPARLFASPKRLAGMGGSDVQFEADTRFWQKQVEDYWKLLNVPSNSIRNVMDMNAFYGGFAAAMINKPLWVMNVVPAGRKDTLPVIYDRGLIGTFHNWCEPFSTYPRTYDLLHAFRVFSSYKRGGKGCQMEDIMLEMDRMLRPTGLLIIRDTSSVVLAAAALAPKFLWNANIHNIYLDGQLHPKEQLLVCHKKFWFVS
eukprot:c20167_g1_i2 orf=363-2150(+)